MERQSVFINEFVKLKDGHAIKVFKFWKFEDGDCMFDTNNGVVWKGDEIYYEIMNEAFGDE